MNEKENFIDVSRSTRDFDDYGLENNIHWTKQWKRDGIYYGRGLRIERVKEKRDM